MVDRLTSCQNQIRVLSQINQELDEELHKSLQKNTAQGVRISTHEVTIGQQTIQIKKLESHAAEGWELADSYNVKIEELQDTLAGLLPTVDDEENRGIGIKRFWFTKR